MDKSCLPSDGLEKVGLDIIAYLEGVDDRKKSFKKLRKAVMKPYKNVFADKDARYSFFASKIADMVNSKKLVYDTDKDIKLIGGVSSVVDESTNVKKKKKRSSSDMEANSGTSGEVRKLSKQAKTDEMVSKEGATADTGTGPATATVEKKEYPKPVYRPEDHQTCILLFYAYCKPPMTAGAQDKAIAACYGKLNSLGMTGRLRVGRDGFNCTLTGTNTTVREFTSFLREFDPRTFATTDFKYVDDLPNNQMLKGLKVWPVTEIVTYGFNPAQAPLENGGIHLKPAEFHEALASKDSILIDVRNYNETLIGKFVPPGCKIETTACVDEDGNERVLDPCMRRSTEFPKWVEDNRHKFVGKKVLMCCTAGVRCERASAFLVTQGIENVHQLDGGIHRYLDAFPEDGGFWKGKNYTFDRRYSHGAENAEVVSECCNCGTPWERYQAKLKCFKCQMEVLVCKPCATAKPGPVKSTLFCPLCK